MIMERLKTETRPFHDRLERDPLSRGLNADDLDPARYRHVLEVYYGLYAPLEARLQQAVDWPLLGFDLTPRLKTAWLQRDLQALGASSAQIAQIPLCTQIPPISDLGAALGCLYVLEGSTLGGQLIARHVAAVLGLRPEHGLMFFSSYGPQVGPMWKAFKQFTESHAAGHEEAIVAAAMATFGSLEQWFSQGAAVYMPSAA